MPGPAKQYTERFELRLTREQLVRLAEMAECLGISKGAVMRGWIETGITALNSGREYLDVLAAADSAPSPGSGLQQMGAPK